MNDCDRANELVRAWEEGRAIGSGDLAFFREHCASCPSCREHFSALLAACGADLPFSNSSYLEQRVGYLTIESILSFE